MEIDAYVVQGILSSVMLSALVLCAHFVRRGTATRMADLLDARTNQPLKETAFYREALNYLGRRQIIAPTRRGTIDEGKSQWPEETLPGASWPYWLAIGFLILVIFTCCLGGYFASEWLLHSERRSLVLGGFYAAYAPMMINGHITVSDAGLQDYQVGTVSVATMAFFSAYIYVVYQIMFRVNTNDISPLSYYFYSLHILAACLVAGIFRHAFEWLYSLPLEAHSHFTDSPGFHPILAVFAVAIGIRPTLWLENVASLANEIWKNRYRDKIVGRPSSISSHQVLSVDSGVGPNAPSPELYRPAPLPLEMIRGMQPGDVRRAGTPDRLREIGIENCQKMATQNPFLLWLRTPFGIHTIIDWIAQAQLVAAWPPHRVASLRERGITDIFQYRACLASNGETRDCLHDALGVPGHMLDDLRSALDQTPQFIKLNELRTKLASIGEQKEILRAAE